MDDEAKPYLLTEASGAWRLVLAARLLCPKGGGASVVTEGAVASRRQAKAWLPDAVRPWRWASRSGPDGRHALSALALGYPASGPGQDCHFIHNPQLFCRRSAIWHG